MSENERKSETESSDIVGIQKRKRGRPRGATSPTLAERSTALALADRGMALMEISRLLDRSPATVRRILADAKESLTAAAGMAVDHVLLASGIAALKGDHRPAWAILQNAGVVEKDAAGENGGVRINIGFALPGLPGAKPDRALVPLAGETVEAVESETVTDSRNG